MTSYSTSPLWNDITPVPLDEGPGPGPALATIAYSEKYSEAMSYLRAIMAKNEFSDRALDLTEDIIGMNPAHYTVWLYRATILDERDKDVLEELKWLEGISVRHLKNYQIWHHRQKLMRKLDSLPFSELPFLTRMLAFDAKNYHVWTYRQWLCAHFPSLHTSPAELHFTETLLHEDVRNNSVWNHRYFLCFGLDELKYGKVNVVVDEEVVEREIEFSQEKIELAPQNASPWGYLKGVLRKGGRSLVEVEDFVRWFTGDASGEGVRSSHAIDWLAEIHAEKGEKEEARKMLEALGRRWDPIRKNYWDYRIRMMEEQKVDV